MRPYNIFQAATLAACLLAGLSGCGGKSASGPEALAEPSRIEAVTPTGAHSAEAAPGASNIEAAPGAQSADRRFAAKRESGAPSAFPGEADLLPTLKTTADFCDRPGSLAFMTRDGCRAALSRLSRDVYGHIYFNSLEDCRNFLRERRNRRNDIVDEHGAWCRNTFANLHDRRGCIDAAPVFLDSFTEREFCRNAPSAPSEPGKNVRAPQRFAAPALENNNEPGRKFDQPRRGRLPAALAPAPAQTASPSAPAPAAEPGKKSVSAPAPAPAPTEAKAASGQAAAPAVPAAPKPTEQTPAEAMPPAPAVPPAPVVPPAPAVQPAPAVPPAPVVPPAFIVPPASPAAVAPATVAPVVPAPSEAAPPATPAPSGEAAPAVPAAPTAPAGQLSPPAPAGVPSWPAAVEFPNVPEPPAEQSLGATTGPNAVSPEAVPAAIRATSSGQVEPGQTPPAQLAPDASTNELPAPFIGNREPVVPLPPVPTIGRIAPPLVPGVPPDAAISGSTLPAPDLAVPQNGSTPTGFPTPPNPLDAFGPAIPNLTPPPPPEEEATRPMPLSGAPAGQAGN